jgi:hypothetical protein
VEVIGSGKTTLISRINLYTSEPNIPFKLYRRLLRIKTAFAMVISEAQEQKLQRVGIYPTLPGFPMASTMWHSRDALHLTTSLVELLKRITTMYRK